ncbi:MAG: hypothetical protein KF768_13830, partial [Phycisphaeraceae bacterium]|nr:hypothetical protein [Phycisphaeraceae bacterium]
EYKPERLDELVPKLAQRIQGILSSDAVARAQNKRCPFELIVENFALSPGDHRREMPIKGWTGNGVAGFKVTFHAKASPVTTRVDVVYLFTDNMQGVVPSQPNVTAPRAPDLWINDALPDDSFVCKYLMTESPMLIQPFGVKHLDFTFVWRGVSFVPIRLECSCNGQLFKWEFVLHLS